VSLYILKVFVENGTLSFQLICAGRSIFCRGVKSRVFYLQKFLLKIFHEIHWEIIYGRSSFWWCTKFHFLLYTKKIHGS